MASTQELYASVTQRIIRELETGVPPWARPWSGQSKGLNLIPANLITGRPYSGINTLILWCEVQEKGYPTHGWCTYQQANEVGARVKKGEKATQVVYVGRKEEKDEKTGETSLKSFLRTYWVFNQAQVENLPPQYTITDEMPDEDKVHESAVNFMKNCGVKVYHGGNKAAYFPQRDQIVLPAFGDFESEEAYWGTALHEVTHASGHKDRLNRNLSGRFGSQAYAAEELVAELGSAFLCARMCIPGTFRSASYIGNWLEVLKKDNQAIFRASSLASQAADFMWEQTYAEQENTPDMERMEPNEKLRDAITM